MNPTSASAIAEIHIEYLCIYSFLLDFKFCPFLLLASCVYLGAIPIPGRATGRVQGAIMQGASWCMMAWRIINIKKLK